MMLQSLSSEKFKPLTPTMQQHVRGGQEGRSSGGVEIEYKGTIYKGDEDMVTMDKNGKVTCLEIYCEGAWTQIV